VHLHFYFFREQAGKFSTLSWKAANIFQNYTTLLNIDNSVTFQIDTTATAATVFSSPNFSITVELHLSGSPSIRIGLTPRVNLSRILQN